MGNNFNKTPITPEIIETFMNGHDPMERIVNLEYRYKDDYITVFYRDENDRKCAAQEPFYPFLWATKHACRRLCGGDKAMVKRKLEEYNIKCVGLDVTNMKGEVVPSIEEGYTVKFEAIRPMSYADFLNFFKACGNPVYSNSKVKTDEKSFTFQPQSKKDKNQYMVVTPKEQYLISTGKRFFKGYEDYDETLRLIFDLETEGLDTKNDRIEKFGIRFNRPVLYKGKKYTFEKIYNIEGETEEEKDASELKNIRTFLKIIYTFMPDIITAHNGEAFDWNMIIGACERLGTSIEAESKVYFGEEYPIMKDKRETILKLGGEIEKFNKTIVPNTIVTDSLHAVRRAQALDSNMLEANLKYVTKYSKMNKVNRVYVPGDLISTVGNDYTEKYAFNDNNGDWYEYDPTYVSSGTVAENTKKDGKFVLVKRNTILDGYELKTGKYIVDRYLLDDLWECDKVEHRYNGSNFLICKMLPVPFDKCCTMGTAGQWKALLLAWSYENNLAVPLLSERKSFVGGLSRLLRVGFVDNVAKFDYNSLYPSITLTWGISDEKDLMDAMLSFLEHVLTQREKYKQLKKVAGKKAEAIKEKLNNRDYASKEEGHQLNAEMMKWREEESSNDKKQLPLKILGNSFFGSFGAPNVFPWGSLTCAERITCSGRQSLRLMIKYFSDLGYAPIVGDSFTGDTPLFVRKNGRIDIIPIEKLIDDDKIETDELGREYDYSEKSYDVLCRSGWVKPSYIYRHLTDKPIYEVSDNEKDMTIEVTEDHSLFNEKMEKIKPSEITSETKLEYYNSDSIFSDFNRMDVPYSVISKAIDVLTSGKWDKFNEYYKQVILNATIEKKRIFYENTSKLLPIISDKTVLASINFIGNCIKSQNA